jgi:hypothetical protein
MIYPDLVPDFMRELELPTYASSITEFPDGAEIRLSLTNNGTGTKIKLEYVNRTAEDVLEIVGFYNSAKGTFKGFLVPISVWRHPLALKNALESLTKGVIWRFADKIEITTVKQNVYNFTVNLVTTSTIIVPSPNPYPDQIL